MAWTTPGTATAGEVLTAAFWNANVRDNFNAQFPLGATLTDFVPTLTSGWALGNATYAAKYYKAGNIVSFYAFITVGSTTTKGTDMRMTLPVAAASVDALWNIGVQFEDVGSAFVLGTARGAGTTSLVMGAINAAPTYASVAQINATVPFTWATGDNIWINGTYLAA